MKKAIVIFIIILGVLGIAYMGYAKKYSIEGDVKELEKEMIEFSNTNKTKPYNSLKIIEQLNIDNKKYVFFTVDDDLGFAALTKGINNKYKIEFGEFGKDLCYCHIVETNEGKYFILLVDNYNNEIEYSKVTIDDLEYTINLQGKGYMSYINIPKNTERTHLETENIKLFNSNNEDITEEIFELNYDEIKSESLENDQGYQNCLQYIKNSSFDIWKNINTNIVERQKVTDSVVEYVSIEKGKEGFLDKSDLIYTIGDTSGHNFANIVCDSETKEVIGYIPIE